jgi:hypothetical protein
VDDEDLLKFPKEEYLLGGKDRKPLFSEKDSRSKIFPDCFENIKENISSRSWNKTSIEVLPREY